MVPNIREITVPHAGEAITEARLIEWLKKEGELVSKGEVLFLVDTDKAVVEVEAPADGRLSKILISEGSIVTTQQVVALLEIVEGERAGEAAIHAIPVGEMVPQDDSHAEATQLPREEEGPSPAELSISTDAIQLAEELGLDWRGISGSGAGGMITVDDVRLAAQSIADADLEREFAPLSKQKQTIAKRIIASKKNVPHFYLTMDVDMSEARRLRSDCLERLKWVRPPTYTDIIVHACALALSEMPMFNVVYTEEGIVSRKTVDIGIVVGLQDGLIVPVLSAADLLDLAETSRRIRELVARARQGRVREGDLVEKSMVVSNLGMFGVDSFYAIIDIPDPMILAVGQITDRIVPMDGQPVIRPFCTLSLSIDHRLLYGIQGASFLGKVKVNLEQALTQLKLN